MAEGEESLGSGDVSTTGVVMLEREAMAKGVAKAAAGGENVEVRLRKPLLPLHDHWYCSSSLFPAVGALKVSPPGVPKKWISKGEAPSHKTAWVSTASGILDLRFQWKEQASCSITLSYVNTILLLLGA